MRAAAVTAGLVRSEDIMTIDTQLAALALVQLAARMQAEPHEVSQRREELDALMAEVDPVSVALRLAGMVLAVAEASRFPLGHLLAAERRDLLTDDDDPPVMV